MRTIGAGVSAGASVLQCCRCYQQVTAEKLIRSAKGCALLVVGLGNC